MCNSTSKLSQMAQNPKSRWSKAEDDLLKENIQKGVGWLHEQLPWRSQKSIRERAKRLSLSWKEPGRLSDFCPECHERRITPGSHAARWGLCKVCYLKEEERRFKQKREELEAARQKEAARQAYYRAAKKKVGKCLATAPAAGISTSKEGAR